MAVSSLSNMLPNWLTGLFRSSPAPAVNARRAPLHAPVRDTLERDSEARSQPVRNGGQALALGLRQPARPATGSASVAHSGGPRAYDPALEDLLAIKAAERDTTLRGIELRFYDPRGIIAAYALDPRYADVSCRDMFANLLQTQRFGPSCGETSNALKSVLFDGDCTQRSGEDALYDSIRNAGDTYLRVQIGCHSFIIEKRDDACRVFQSYDGWYSMAQSLKDDKAIPTETFIRELRRVIRKDQAPNRRAYAQARAAEERLFHGEVDATRNARGSQRYQIVTEVPQRRTPVSQLGTRFDTLLDRYDTIWTGFQNDNRQTVSQFCRRRWPDLFGA